MPCAKENQGLSLPGIAGRHEERSTCPILEARGEIFPGETPGGGKAVHGRVGLGGAAVRLEETPHGTRPARRDDSGVQDSANLEQGLCDDAVSTARFVGKCL